MARTRNSNLDQKTEQLHRFPKNEHHRAVQLSTNRGTIRQPTEGLFVLASWLGLLPAFETRITGCGELLLEFIDPTSRIYKLQLARVERVALVANVDLQFLSSAVCHKFVPTATRYLGLNILGVDAFFHRRGLYNLLLVRWNLALFILAEVSQPRSHSRDR